MRANKATLGIVILILLGCGPPVDTRKSGPFQVRKTKRELVLDHLRVQRPIAKEAITEAISPERASELTEADWAKVMVNLRKRLDQDGPSKHRDEILSGKQQVYEAWKYQFEVLVELSRVPGAELRRYDEGQEGSTGFVVMQSGEQRYWLHWKFNRERDEY
jgi:hypothetical protein